jgi:hypothetical protein
MNVGIKTLGEEVRSLVLRLSSTPCCLKQPVAEFCQVGFEVLTALTTKMAVFLEFCQFQLR